MKKFKPTPDQISAAQAVFVAMAYVDTLRPKIEEIHAKIMYDLSPLADVERWTKDGRNCLPEDEQVYIIKWSHLYMAKDEEARKCFDLNNKLMKEAGFDVKPDYCPLLIAEDLLRQAQRLLIESMHPIIKMSVDDLICSKGGMKNYTKVIDLTLGLLAPYVKNIAA